MGRGLLVVAYYAAVARNENFSMPIDCFSRCSWVLHLLKNRLASPKIPEQQSAVGAKLTVGAELTVGVGLTVGEGLAVR